MAGSLDDNPPVILGSDDYLAAVVLLPGEDNVRYSIYRAPRAAVISRSELVYRLRCVLDAMEKTPDE